MCVCTSVGCASQTAGPQSFQTNYARRRSSADAEDDHRVGLRPEPIALRCLAYSVGQTYDLWWSPLGRAPSISVESHPRVYTCRLNHVIPGLQSWLRRVFPVAARHAAQRRMMPGNGLNHWGGTGRALEHRSHVPARPRTIRAQTSNFSRSAWLREAEPGSHRHRE